MTKMKPGKYAGHKFTKEQEDARRLWRRADLYSVELREALHCIDFPSRKVAHEKLDRRYDAIEKLRANAKELFPDVAESFTVATMSIKL